MEFTSVRQADWVGTDGPLAGIVVSASQMAVASYAQDPRLVEEHFNIERATAEGGYERRQVFELIQNAADAMLHDPGTPDSRRIEVVLTADALYCANVGRPVDEAGVVAILHSHLSRKRGFEIGRFGLGFKSVLAVTDRPMVFSRSGSFGFDPEYSVTRIKGVVPTAEHVPSLRVAFPLDPMSAAAEDPVLAGLMEWATTVVKLPRTREVQHLDSDLADFPAEFLLFSPHVDVVRLTAPVDALDRYIRVRREEEGVIELSDNLRSARWKVLSVPYKVSDTALAGAGEFSEREEVRLHWAVPLEESSRRGCFWAFFPTHYETTLSGVLNGPWKTQEDRQNLLEGEFNRELINAAALMVVANCGALSSPDDPARHLDKFPARGREGPNWADKLLTELVYDTARRDGECLPNMDGILCASDELQLHPRSLPEEALEIWASVPGRPRDWCHKSVETRDRRPRVERILGRPAAPASEWIGALVALGTPEASAAMIRILSIVDDKELTHRTRAVLTTTGQWVQADLRNLFLVDGTERLAGVHIVSSDVMEKEGVREALARLGVRSLDALGEIDAVLSSSRRSWKAKDWERFWILSRRVPIDDCIDLLRARRVVSEIQARTCDGTFRRVLTTLLPGSVVGPEDAGVTIDVDYHQPDLALLVALGAVDAPRGGTDVTDEPWFFEFEEVMQNAYLRASNGGSRPQRDYLEFDQHEAVGPLGALPALSLESACRFTSAALSEPGALERWTMRHRTQAQYPRREVDGPTRWMLRSYGVLQTSLGPRPCREAFGRALAPLERWLPVVDLDAGVCEALGIQTDPGGVPSQAWNEALTASLQDPTEDVGVLYAAAARAGIPAPARLGVPGGGEAVAPGLVAVVLRSDPDARVVLDARNTPFVVVEQGADVDVLVERWGLSMTDDSLEVEVVTAEDEAPEEASTVFPLLTLYGVDQAEPVEIVRAADVELRIPGVDGIDTRSVQSHWDGRILTVADDVDDAALLNLVLEHSGIALDDDGRRLVLEQRAAADVEDLKARCRDQEDDAARLTELLDSSTLRSSLPSGLVDAVAQNRGVAPSGREIAELVLAVHGIDALAYFRDQLADRAIAVPTLNGGARARRFVADLGFPAAFAGSVKESRDPLFRVHSSPELPPLHEYQEGLVEQVRRLVRREDGNRGLLSLPTGAGKTRVAAEALIDAWGAGEVVGPVIWIAQSDELCEQAVQTWAYLWRALGDGATLAISRLWSGNEAEPVGDDLQVVVATVQKLNSVSDSTRYDWLTHSDVVVVDEAHGSSTPMYTTVLGRLGLTGQRRRRDASLIGLTATPFRGVNEDENRRLADRYDRRKLESAVLGEDPYKALQGLGVLAKVEHRLLPGSDFTLTSSELEELTTLRKLPKAVERRVGEDGARNRALLDTIRGFPDDWSSILFCASVPHAELMAALLTLEGIPAETISGTTPVNRRHHAVEEFRQGRIRVLTNYGVLQQGFDAPRVQAIIVGRPTYSPVAYQQMIGRGLRGPLNGGSDTCLIVNVEDTFAQFGERLAFRDFDYLWSAE